MVYTMGYTWAVERLPDEREPDMAVTQPRPDLEAHDHAVRADFETVASELRELLGARLVAYLGGGKGTRAVHEWADGGRHPSDDTQRLRRGALQVAILIDGSDGPEVTQAW